MIIKDYVPPNHAPTTFHRVLKVTLHPPFTMATVEVVSYASEAAYLAGASHTWAERYQAPMQTVSGPIMDHLENWLVDAASTQPDGTPMPFGGGLLVGDRMETLGNAQERVWTRAKYARQRRLAEPFECDGRVFDADVENVMGASVKAFIATSQGLEVSQKFTLADNTDVTLTANEIINVGMVLGARNDAIYEIGRALRRQIFDVEVSESLTEAAAIALVAAITWP